MAAKYFRAHVACEPDCSPADATCLPQKPAGTPTVCVWPARAPISRTQPYWLCSQNAPPHGSSAAHATCARGAAQPARSPAAVASLSAVPPSVRATLHFWTWQLGLLPVQLIFRAATPPRASTAKPLPSSKGRKAAGGAISGSGTDTTLSCRAAVPQTRRASCWVSTSKPHCSRLRLSADHLCKSGMRACVASSLADKQNSVVRSWACKAKDSSLHSNSNTSIPKNEEPG